MSVVTNPPAASAAFDPTTILNDYIIVDFETTGLDPAIDSVIEIGAVRIVDGHEAQRLAILINPFTMEELPAKTTELTGLTMDDLELAGSDERTAFRAFYQFAGNRLIVAHNALYEAGFLEAAYRHLSGGKMGLTNPLLCTLTLARQRWSYPHKLIDCIQRINGPVLPAHRALPDVLMTHHLLQHLRGILPVETYVNRIAHYAKYGPPAFVPDYVNCFPM